MEDVWQLIPWIAGLLGSIYLFARLWISFPPQLGALPKDPGFVIPAVISMLVLGSCLYIILSGNYEEATHKWAYGMVGTIMGYWLKG